MIIAHFFVRKKRHRPFMYVETTCEKGEEQPEPVAAPLFEIDPYEPKEEWKTRAMRAFLRRHPDFVVWKNMDNRNRLDSDHPAFDLTFVRKGEAD